MTRHHAAAVGLSSDCVICGKSLSFHQQVAGDICDEWRCRWNRLDRQVKAHRREAAYVLGETHPEAYPALVVPDHPGKIESLPTGRCLDHLEFIISLAAKVLRGEGCDENAGDEPGGSGPEPPPVAPAEAVCAVCGGACCHRGGNQAFLDTAALKRVSGAHPKKALPDIVNHYAMYLPAQSYKDSCVYHTSVGCALPRSLRAGVCNAYRCSGLKQAERWINDVRITRVYVVVRKDNIITRGAFVQPGNIRHYPPREAEPSKVGLTPRSWHCRQVEHRTSNIEHRIRNSVDFLKMTERGESFLRYSAIRFLNM